MINFSGFLTSLFLSKRFLSIYYEFFFNHFFLINGVCLTGRWFEVDISEARACSEKAIGQ